MFKCTNTTSKLLLCIRMCALLLSILKYISLLTLLSYIKKKSSTTSSSTTSPGGNIKILILLFFLGGGVLLLLFLCLWPFWNTFWINWKVFAMQPLGSCKKCPLFMYFYWPWCSQWKTGSKKLYYMHCCPFYFPYYLLYQRKWNLG